MDAITLGAVKIFPYGLGLALSLVGACLFLAHTCRRAELKGGTASWIAVLGIPLGLLFARLFYCLIRMQWFLRKGVAFFWQFQKGGFFLYGTLLGVVLAGLITARITRQKAMKVLDAMVLPGTLMLSLGYLLMGLAGEGYGWSVSEWFSVDYPSDMSLFTLSDVSFFSRFPFAIPNYYGEYHWAVFVLEAIIAALIGVRLYKDRSYGEKIRPLLFLCYLAPLEALGAGMRQDAVLKWGFVKAAEILTVVLMTGLLVYACIAVRDVGAGRKVCSFVLLVASFGLFMAMEFALEKKIAFLTFMKMDMCYVGMIGACLLMVASVRPLLVRKAQT